MKTASTAFCAGEDGDDEPEVAENLVTRFKVPTNPPLTPQLIDELSHLISDFLGVSGYVLAQSDLGRNHFLPVTYRNEKAPGNRDLASGGAGNSTLLRVKG